MNKLLKLSVQRATRLPVPGEAKFSRWVQAALSGAKHRRAVEVVIRLVNEAEGRKLNHSWRGKNHATNVLSFPAVLPAGMRSPLLGDLVMCAPVVRREAAEQDKTADAHWAHLTVHGTLHLLGYDHEVEAQAQVMESLEIAVLAGLGYPDPYA